MSTETKLPSAQGRWGIAEGRAVIEAWRGSGLSLREFADRHDLHLVRLQRWRKRVEREDGQDAERVSVGLVPAVMRVPEAPSASAPLTVRLPDGTVVEVHDECFLTTAAVVELVTGLRRGRP